MRTSLKALLCLNFYIITPTITKAQVNVKVFDSLAIEGLSKNVPGTVIYLSRGDQILYTKAFGKANIELDVDMKVDHTFRIGSITKQFTACAILKLMEQNKLSLTDDIRKYIPDFPSKNEVISIEALLTHTSGIINYTGLPSFTEELKRKDLTPKQLIDLFKDEPLEFKPGTDYKYSNSGYVLLGYIIEKLTNKSYGEYIDEVIFKPLGMKNSYYDNPNKLIVGRVYGYTQRNGHYRNANFLSMTLPYAAGSLVSNAADLQRWYTALHNGQFLKPETIKKAFSPFKLGNGRSTGYGYGWEIGNVQKSASVKHVGAINGFFTYAAYLPHENLSISILTNCDSPTELDILASKMLAIALGMPYNYKEITLTKSKMEDYQGVYKLENGEEYTIRLQDGSLMYYPKGGLKTHLIPCGNAQFVLENTLSAFSFNKNKAGEIDGFTINGTGLPTNGSRKNIRIEAQTRISIPAKLLQSYTGKYHFNPGPVFEVKLEDNKLYGQVGNDKKELVPFTKNKFFARFLDASIIFNIDAKGNVVSLTKIQNSEMIAKKF